MKNLHSLALVAAFALSSPGFAAEPPHSVDQQIKKLMKMVGAGEISNKDYNKRKQALLAEAQQSAQVPKK